MSDILACAVTGCLFQGHVLKMPNTCPSCGAHKRDIEGSLWRRVDL